MTVTKINDLLVKKEITPYEAFNQLIKNQSIYVSHSQKCGDETKITLNYKDLFLVDLIINPKLKNKSTLGVYKCLEIYGEEDYNRAIIEGDAEFVISELLQLIPNIQFIISQKSSILNSSLASIAEIS